MSFWKSKLLCGLKIKGYDTCETKEKSENRYTVSFIVVLIFNMKYYSLRHSISAVKKFTACVNNPSVKN